MTLEEEIIDKKVTLCDFGIDITNVDFNHFTNGIQLDRYCRKLIYNAIIDPKNPRYKEAKHEPGKRHNFVNDILTLHSQGLNNKSIVAKLGCSPRTVRNNLKKYGLQANMT